MAQTSDFQFNGFIIEESYIKLNSVDGEGESELNIDISPAGTIIRDSGKYKLRLALEVTSSDDSIKIRVIAIGNYSFKNKVDLDDLSNYFFLNAPAILFPYLRAYITTLTTLSGLAPIILPTFNLMDLKEQLKENTTTV